MKPIDEHKLYMTDRGAWVRYVAPRTIRRLEAAAGKAERRRMWDALASDLQDEIRRLRRQHTSSAS